MEVAENVHDQYTGHVPKHRLKQCSIFKMIINELNDPQGPENIIRTMMMYGEMFYGRHTAQHQLQWR